MSRSGLRTSPMARATRPIAYLCITCTLAVSVTASACGGERRAPFGPHVALASGTYLQGRWTLTAWRNSDNLFCMEMVFTDPSIVAPGGCSFNNKPGGGYYVSGDVAPNGDESFGPLPLQATSVRISETATVPAHTFPAGRNLPAGKFWLQTAGRGWKPAARGDLVIDPQPLDKHGLKVAFVDF